MPSKDDLIKNLKQFIEYTEMSSLFVADEPGLEDSQVNQFAQLKEKAVTAKHRQQEQIEVFGQSSHLVEVQIVRKEGCDQTQVQADPSGNVDLVVCIRLKERHLMCSGNVGDERYEMVERNHEG